MQLEGGSDVMEEENQEPTTSTLIDSMVGFMLLSVYRAS